MTEPKAEINAILETKESLGFYPVSIFRYALLEAIASPFLDKTKDFSILSIIPSWFVMTQKPEKLATYGDNIKEIIDASYLEAENLIDPQNIVNFTRNFLKHLYGIQFLEPESTSGEETTKKAQTAS